MTSALTPVIERLEETLAYALKYQIDEAILRDTDFLARLRAAERIVETASKAASDVEVLPKRGALLDSRAVKDLLEALAAYEEMGR